MIEKDYFVEFEFNSVQVYSHVNLEFFFRRHLIHKEGSLYYDVTRKGQFTTVGRIFDSQSKHIRGTFNPQKVVGGIPIKGKGSHATSRQMNFIQKALERKTIEFNLSQKMCISNTSAVIDLIYFICEMETADPQELNVWIDAIGPDFEFANKFIDQAEYLLPFSKAIKLKNSDKVVFFNKTYPENGQRVSYMDYSLFVSQIKSVDSLRNFLTLY